jgi:ribosome-binding protein aMBF1 (putative translation factor)
MNKGISEIVGHAELLSGESRQVYRALRSLLCSTCGTEIMEGAHFTRRHVKGIGVSIMPQCQKCAPFILQASKQEKSALLRSLLTEQTPDSSRRASVSPENSSNTASEEKRVSEEVRRRLGPALKRGRHKSGGK